MTLPRITICPLRDNMLVSDSIDFTTISHQAVSGKQKLVNKVTSISARDRPNDRASDWIPLQRFHLHCFHYGRDSGANRSQQASEDSGPDPDLGPSLSHGTADHPHPNHGRSSTPVCNHVLVHTDHVDRNQLMDTEAVSCLGLAVAVEEEAGVVGVAEAVGPDTGSDKQALAEVVSATAGEWSPEDLMEAVVWGTNGSTAEERG